MFDLNARRIHYCRHPGNYLSTRLCLVSDRLLSGIHGLEIRIKKLESRKNLKFSILDSDEIVWIPAFAGMTKSGNFRNDGKWGDSFLKKIVGY